MSGPDAPTLAQALVLGVLHGPAELMPISSSGHVALLAGDMTEVGQAFAVALHAGTAAGLLVAARGEAAGARGEAAGARRSSSPAVAVRILLATLPPAVLGLALERPIERRLGTPATVAAGLIAGSAAMAWADATPGTRRAHDAGAGDALWLGIAQACALVPGVSRNGATLAAARRRGFARADAERLSRQVALPVIAGATLLKARRLASGGLPAGAAAPFALGTAASFCSTLAAARIISPAGRSLGPYVAYRLAVAALLLRRAGRTPRSSRRSG